jgi:DNA mismatch repair ATPase MutS
MHFCEHVEGTELVFDYVLKEGPCPTSNALLIMKAQGLPVEEGL